MNVTTQNKLIDELKNEIQSLKNENILLKNKQIEIDDKKNEHLLKEKIAYIESIFLSLPSGVGVVKERIFSEVNDHMCLITGYTRKELLNHNSRMLYANQEAYERVGKEKYKMISKYGTGSVETQFKHKDGTIIDVLLSSTPIDSFDISKGVTFTATDITEQKKLEKELLQSYKTLINIAGNVPGVVCTFQAFTDGRSCFPYASDHIYDIYGVTPQEVREDATKANNTIHPEDLEDWGKSVQISFTELTLWEEKFRVIHPDKGLIWIKGIALPEKQFDGSVLWYGYLYDITELKKKDEMIINQSRHAAMGEMIGMIAHQWRQPLSTISTASTGAKLQKEMDCLSDEQLNSSLTAINNAAQYLSKTIDDFRDFFNPSNNKKTEFNISDTITKALQLVSAQFIAKDIDIIKNIEEYELVSIQNELVQVLINILNNARDVLISKENQKRLIFINTYKEDTASYIEILDNAGGIKKDIINRIFEPYFTTKHQSQGTGIGLYMSEEIVHKHLHGNLLVTNETFFYEDIKYTGAKFTIEIMDD